MTQKDLPDGWTRVRTEKVFELNYGKGLTKATRDETGTIPVYGSNGIVGVHSEAITDGPSIIVGRKGAAGAVRLSNDPCWPIDTTYYTYPSEAVLLRYGYYLLSSLNLETLDRSTAIPGLNRDDFYSQQIPLAPLPEQKRIVAKIEELFTQLDAGVAALKRAQANLKRYKASVLKAACEGRLVPTEAELHPEDYEPADVLLERILAERRARWEVEHPGKKYKEPASPDVEGLPDLPEGWVWATVEQLADVGTGSTPLRSNEKYWVDGTIPWVKSGALNELFVDEAKEYITPIALRETNVSIFPGGTLLVAMYGEGKTRGKVSELTFESTTNQAIAGIVFPDYSHKLKKYTKLFFRKNYEDIRRLSSGGVQPNLNLSTIKNTTLPIPPMAEGQRIVNGVERYLSVIEEQENEIEKSLKRADRLCQAILKRAFEGKLVPQDPTDEPASELLKRVNEEGKE